MISSNVFASDIEYKLKAAYLYQFTKFTEWPDNKLSDNDAAIQICVLGNNPFGQSLKSFSHKTSQNHTLSITVMSSQKNILKCHILFISKSEENKLEKILQQIEHSPVLSVSDIKDFALRGGIIGFAPKNKKIGIEINAAASHTAGTKLSSKLLEVATLIQGQSRNGNR